MSKDQKADLQLPEFVALAALMTSLVAMSIDALLPALPYIARDLQVENLNDRQLVVSMIFAGLALGQIVYGPLSDSIGRKPCAYLGLGLFIAGCLVSLLATSFTALLLGRLLQGIGIAGPRIVTLAMVRDLYEGPAMARVMSFIMGVFILVPAVAPMVGQGILAVSGWRMILVLYIVLTVTAFLWLALRQRETLPAERRIPLSLIRLSASFREIFTNRIAMGYTIMAGLVLGAFIGYLGSAQQILQELYGLGTQFPLYFAVLALSIGCASFVNARLVVKLGMRRLSREALIMLSGLSALFFLVALYSGGQPPLWALMMYLLASFFCIGILFGNVNALAMEPLGHIAGVGAAVIGSVSSMVAVPLGMLIGAAFDGTVLPLVAGFAILGTAALVLMKWT